MALISTLFFAVLLMYFVWSGAEGGRVVVLPMPHTSHIKYHSRVARELVRMGHVVWLAIPDYVVASGVLDTSSIGIIEYTTGTNVEENSIRVLQDFSGKSQDFSQFIQIIKQFSDMLLKNDTFFDVIKHLGPDFIIIDNVIVKMLCIIPYRLGVPFAFVGSSYDPVGQRVPFAPAVTPIALFPFTDHMNFTHRLVNAFVHLVTAVHDFSVDSDAVATYAPDMPYLPLDMLVARAEIWLVETDHILDYPRPSLPNVKLIGGTAAGPAKPLPPEFQSFMDSATQGVVIVSFGSYILNLPQDIGDKLLQMLLHLPLKSVFRSNLTSPDPDKILTASWIPQNDLLAHPNTKVLFSHCGKNSQYEALYHAVPMVATPMFSDQFYNAERIRIKGFSESVDIKTMTADELGKAIMKVAAEKRYKQAIRKASELFRIEFGVPMESAAFWLDHVMKYGGAHMRSAGHNIPYYQFVGLDIIIVLTTALLLGTFVPIFICYLILRRIYKCYQKQKKE